MNSKEVLSDLYYSFNANDKTITFNVNLKKEDFLLITNIIDNTIIYNFGCSDLGGNLAGNVLTLTYDTSSMSSSDKLMIIIKNEDKKELYLERLLSEIKTQNEYFNNFICTTEELPLISILIDVIKDNKIKESYFKNINTADTFVCKTGNGLFEKIIINNPTNNSITIYDGLSTSGKVIAVIDPDTSAVPIELNYNVNFFSGLVVTTAGTPDITIIYK